MAANTVEELGDDLHASLAWRRLESHALKSELDSVPTDERELPRGRGLRRAAAAMLYAHWEGYVKEACQGYLDFVARRKLKYSELSDAFVALGLQRTISGAHVRDPSSVRSMIEAVRRGPELRARIQRTGVVNTRSNLRHEVLVEILGALGLPHESFSLRANLIDRTLCDTRNDIAHGRDSCPDPAAFVALYYDVLALMGEVQGIILAAAGAGDFRNTALPIARPLADQ